MRRRLIVVLVLVLACAWPALAAEPLPSWNDGKARNAILSFVARVTKEGGPEFVPPAERIAVFDNDGTLWSEQPMYFQALFIFDRIKALAPQHPEWKDKEPFASVLKGDVKAALAGGERVLFIDDKEENPVGIQQQSAAWREGSTRPARAAGSSSA